LRNSPKKFEYFFFQQQKSRFQKFFSLPVLEFIEEKEEKFWFFILNECFQGGEI